MENELISKYGHILFAQPTGYWKYQFTVSVKTDLGFEVDIVTGGNHELIHYNPFSSSWSHICKLPKVLSSEYSKRENSIFERV
jgi:hypothetical protein